MQKAPIPVNEQQRLKDLYDYDILNTSPEPDFDDLVELAAQICKCPISLITLLDKDLQWFKAKIGINASYSSREMAFCSYVIMEDELLVVEDTTKDGRFQNHPSVTEYPNVRFYAGAPIVSPTGYKLGTICIADLKPRTLSPEEHRALLLLSNQVTTLLEIRRKDMHIREKSEEITRLKSNAIGQYLNDIEIEKKSIANYLHEQFAQEISSVLVYLKMAKSENHATKFDYYHSIEDQLKNTLNNIRNLSYKITPLANQLLDTKDMISEYVKSVALTFRFKINLSLPDINNSPNPDVLVTLVRVIELWLKILNNQTNVTIVNITVALKPQLVIRITNNGDIANYSVIKKQVLHHVLCDKIYSYGGSIEMPVLPGQTLFTIILPLEHPEYASRL